MSDPRDNPFAPPEELADDIETRPWLFDEGSRVRVERHPPLRRIPWVRKTINSLAHLIGSMFVAAVVMVLPVVPSGILALVFHLFFHVVDAGPVFFVSYAVFLFVCLFFAQFISSPIDHFRLLSSLAPIESLLSRDDPKGDWYAVSVTFVRHGWLRNRFLRDVGVLYFEKNGLRIEGNRLNAVVPFAAIEEIGINARHELGGVRFRKQCCREYQSLVLRPIPHRIPRLSFNAWKREVRRFLERFEALTP